VSAVGRGQDDGESAGDVVNVTLVAERRLAGNLFRERGSGDWHDRDDSNG
jgi:hypothetical protein